MDVEDSPQSGEPLETIPVHFSEDLVAKSKLFWTKFHSPCVILQNSAMMFALWNSSYISEILGLETESFNVNDFICSGEPLATI